MTEPMREVKLANAFVKLADTLVADFDLVDLLQTLVETCVDVLDSTAAGLLLKDPSGRLQVVASTSEEAAFVEVVQLGASAGPCWECATTGRPVTIPDIEAVTDRWPRFREAALQRGFRSVHATPMRLRDDVLGTMNLFDTSVGALSEQDVSTAQALSDVATIGILSERGARRHETVAGQLKGALDSRIVIEQAKGVLAQSTGVSMEDAFTSLRSFARSNSRNLRDVANALIERRLEPSRVVANSRLRGSSASPPRRPNPNGRPGGE